MELTSHDTGLYTLGKGILSFDRFDADGLPTGLRDLGNCTDFRLIPTEEELEHWTDRTPIRRLDLVVPKSQRFGGRFTLDEYDRDNLRAFLFGATGSFAIHPMTSIKIEGEIDFLATNAYGPQYHCQLWKCKLRPTGDIGFISENWAPINFEFTVEDDTANHPESPWGALTLLAQS